jgi:hypothetical protein
MTSLMVYYSHQILQVIDLKDNNTSTCGVHGRGEMHTGFWWGNLRIGDHLDDRGVHKRMIVEWIIKKQEEVARIVSSGSGQGEMASS